MDAYRQLEAWHLARDLALAIYELSARFPGHERFGLTSQIRRAAVSVPANIAEGHARAGAGEFRQFLNIALGSLAEIDTLMELAEALGYVDAEPLGVARVLRTRTSKAVFALKRNLRR